MSISNEAAEAAEEQALDAALRSSSWMTRQQLESFVRIALQSARKERMDVAIEKRRAAIVEAVVNANFEAFASAAFASSTSSASSTSYAAVENRSMSLSAQASAALDRLVRSMNAKMKRVFVEKATSTMSKEQMRNFVIEA